VPRRGAGILARLALILGGVGGVLLTPPFALSFFLSFGAGERPPVWLARLREPLVDAGLLIAGSESRYDNYGMLYLAAWGLDYAVPWWSAFAVGVLGVVAVVGGLGLLGHIPTGPGLGFLVAGVVIGLTGKVSPSRPVSR
jgi:hypothetical protein